MKEEIKEKIWSIIIEGYGDEIDTILKFIDKCSLVDFKKLKDMKREIDKEKDLT